MMATGLGLMVTPKTLRNLAQVRARNAYEATMIEKYVGEGGGEVAKKLPPLIVQHGLLGAIAFACDDKGGYLKVFKAILKHLQDKNINDPTARDVEDEDVEKWFVKIAGSTSAELRAVTAETLAYLSYFRRFAKKNGESNPSVGGNS